jgi:hypothetical protein
MGVDHVFLLSFRFAIVVLFFPFNATRFDLLCRHRLTRHRQTIRKRSIAKVGARNRTAMNETETLAGCDHGFTAIYCSAAAVCRSMVRSGAVLCSPSTTSYMGLIW